MKKTLATFIIILFAAGCCHPIEEGFSISEHEISCGPEGGIFEITVSGRQDWVSDNTQKWIDIKRKDGLMVLTVCGNDGGERQSVIRISAGKTHEDIYLVQSCSEKVEASCRSIEADWTKAHYKIGLECYTKWEAESSADWIKPDVTAGEGPAEINISVEQNHEIRERSGSIIFKGAGDTLTVNVFQKEPPFIELESDVFETDGDGGTFLILYMTNTEVEISTEFPWIRIIDSGSNITKVDFEILRNPEYAPREGTITITSKEYPQIFKTITVRQGEKIDHPSLSFEEGSFMEVSSRDGFTLHPIFTDMSDKELVWSSDNPETASIDQSGRVCIKASGICEISIANHYHDVSASIRLNIRLIATSMSIFLGAQNMKETSMAVRFPGEKMEVRVEMNPSDSYQGDIIMISSAPEIASFKGYVLECLAPGKAVIYVESAYNNLTESFTLIVLDD